MADSDDPAGHDDFIAELTKKKISREVVDKIEEHSALSDPQMWSHALPDTLPAFYSAVRGA